MVNNLVQTVRRYDVWIIKLALSIGDQGIVSGTNFLLNIILARKISTEAYGAFSVGFSIFLLLSGLHNALLLEPMTVLSPKNIQWKIGVYLKTTVLFNFILTGISGILLALIALFFSQTLGKVYESLIGVSLTTPFILLFWLLRRACYIQASPSLAMQGSGIYGFVVLSGITILFLVHGLSPFLAFLLMGLASIMASIFYLYKFNRQFQINEKAQLPVRQILQLHWNYGKWATGSAVVYWLSNAVSIPLIGLLIGLSQAGIFRALQVTILPLQQVIIAASTLILPRLSGQWSTYNVESSRKLGSRILLIIIMITVSYSSILGFFNRQIVSILYGNHEYTAYSILLYYLGGFAILDAMNAGLSMVCRAAEKPNTIFWSQLGGAFVLISVTLFLIPIINIQGAAIALLIAGGVNFIILFVSYYNLVPLPKRG